MVDRLRVGRGAARAGHAQGTPTQSHISPSILVYEDKTIEIVQDGQKDREVGGEEECEATQHLRCWESANRASTLTLQVYLAHNLEPANTEAGSFLST